MRNIFRGFWKFLKNIYFAIVSILAIVLILFVVYWRDFAVLANEALKNEAMSHLFLVPVLIFYMVYHKREMLKASILFQNFSRKVRYISVNEIFGFSLCFLAFLLYWYGNYTFYVLEYHLVSLIVFLVGLILVLFGFKTLITLIPAVLFLLFLMPPPSNFTFSVGALLGNFNAQASYELLKVVGIPVALSYKYGPPIVIVRNPMARYFEFAIDLPCSGIYSLIAFVTFAVFLVYILNGSMIKKLVLFPLGFIILPILNVFRISLIISLAHWFGVKVAMTVFHVFSGWVLVFLGVLLLLLIAEKFLRLELFKAQNRGFACSECNHSFKKREFFCLSCGRLLKTPRLRVSNRFWAKIIVLLFASSVITFSIRAPIFAYAQGLTIANVEPAKNIDVFPRIENYQLKFLFRDLNFERVSRQDASLLYAYFPQNSTAKTVYVLIGVAGSIVNLHSWEVCLVTWQASRGYPPLVTVLDSRDVQLISNPPITARYFTFKHLSNYTQVTLYWYQKALFKTGLTVEPKYVRISLITLTKASNEVSKLEEKLLTIGRSIALHWEPLKAQSLISLGVPTIQILLFSTLFSVIVIQATNYTREWRRKKINQKIFNGFAPSDEKLLYSTIVEISKKTHATTRNIAAAFKKMAGKSVELDKLTMMLTNLETYGLVKKDVVNVQNWPKLIWKT
jgi:exosortase